ncbi:MAG: type VI secretion system baseplate subunit TssF/IglH [Candidatus Sedimenticola sp. (ex Thyasira tokunagai)]
MSDNALIHQQYLQQLQGLETFRQAYQEVFPTAALERDDPELKRLTEAIAYCTAHAQHSAHCALQSHHQTLVEHIHPYMVSPLVAKTIVQVIPDAKLQQSYELAPGCRFELNSEEQSSADFVTCMPLTILPLQYHQFELASQGSNRLKLTLGFNGFVTMEQQSPEIPIYLNVLNDLNATLALYNALIADDVVAELYFEGEQTPRSCQLGHKSCQFRPRMHPIETIRNALHFPYAQFFVYVRLLETPAKWRSFNLVLSIKSQQSLQNINQDCFRPFCTPMINLSQRNAQNIWCDGTKSQYPLLNEYLTEDAAIHSVLGVYQQLNEQKTPLIPSVVHQGNNTFALLTGTKNRLQIDLSIADAFTNPRYVIIDALWYQPNFSRVLWQKLTVMPYDIDIPGVQWQLSEARQLCVVPSDAEGKLTLFELLAIRSNEVVSAALLTQLFHLFSATSAAEFAPVVDGFIGVNATSEQASFVFEVALANSNMAIGELFLAYFQAAANDWFAVDNIRLTLGQAIK